MIHRPFRGAAGVPPLALAERKAAVSAPWPRGALAARAGRLDLRARRRLLAVQKIRLAR